jgi:hypothetical protein
MKLKNTALFALSGMILLTVLLATGFLRDQIGFHAQCGRFDRFAHLGNSFAGESERGSIPVCVP